MTREKEKQKYLNANLSALDSIALKAIDNIFDDIESRLCTNCKHRQWEVCTNDKSPLCATSVDAGFGCVYFERG